MIVVQTVNKIKTVQFQRIDRTNDLVNLEYFIYTGNLSIQLRNIRFDGSGWRSCSEAIVSTYDSMDLQ
jgi:hypothetical protein